MGLGAGGGEAGTKWEQLPWAGDERPPPACTASGTFRRGLFGKHRPRGPRWAGTPTLFSKVSSCVGTIYTSALQKSSRQSGGAFSYKGSSFCKKKKTKAWRKPASFLASSSPLPPLRGSQIKLLRASAQDLLSNFTDGETETSGQAQGFLSVFPRKSGKQRLSWRPETQTREELCLRVPTSTSKIPFSPVPGI